MQGPHTASAEDHLYRRGERTLLASWAEYARGSVGAALLRLRGVAAGVFPVEPERSVYNNAVLDRGLHRDERFRAIHAMESAYAEAGLSRYAAWAHESDAPLQAELRDRDYRVKEINRVMGMPLGGGFSTDLEFDCQPLDWAHYLAYLRLVGLPEGLLAGVDPAAFHVLGIRLGGDCVATAIAFDQDGDCGIYNMSTLEPFRRRGLGTALLIRHLQDAIARGCSSASLQSTPIAEGVYASVGFRDLGRYFEYVPVRCVGPRD